MYVLYTQSKYICDVTLLFKQSFTFHEWTDGCQVSMPTLSVICNLYEVSFFFAAKEH